LRLVSLLALGFLAACAGPPRKSVLQSDPAQSASPAAGEEQGNGENPRQSPREAPPLSSREEVRTLLHTARSYLGAPYRYGGESTRGFDCSGLVWSVFAQLGISLPRSCAAQARRGLPVARAQLAAGDLVFFGRAKGAPTHVGIYEGGNSFIHASTGKGQVRRDRLDESWFARHYRGARRIPLP
jgi:cell wall-associated NlpC family hydrolase